MAWALISVFILPAKETFLLPNPVAVVCFIAFRDILAAVIAPSNAVEIDFLRSAPDLSIKDPIISFFSSMITTLIYDVPTSIPV